MDHLCVGAAAGSRAAWLTAAGDRFQQKSDFNPQPLDGVPALAGWDTSRCVSMRGMFDGATAFSQSLAAWDTEQVADFSYMFASSAFNGQVNSWKVGSLLNASGMFEGYTAFNEELGDWEVSGVQDMSRM